MNSLWVLVFWVVILIVGYWVYARWASRKVFEADPSKATPAKMYMDGVDFMPANKNVLFGFQLNSITGAAPIVGPIVALQWGWLPAMLWLGLGVLFIGWLHDYSSAMVSVRHEGETFGAISYKLISPRARGILLAFIYFYLLLTAVAFLNIVASGLVGTPSVPFPMLVVVGVGFLVGYMIYKAKVNIIRTTVLAIVLIFAAIWAGNYLPIKASYTVMLVGVCIFAYFSAVLPVWMFIQPFNYSSVYVVYFAIIVGVIGILVGAKPLTLPAFTGWSTPIGPLWPLLFVTIACGAISGWHSLVNSTATSRQIENEIDVRPVSAGAMFTEFTIGIIALIACATAFADKAGYLGALKDPVGIFKVSLGGAMGALGIPASYAESLSAAMIVILAITVLNLLFRFMKVATIELLGDKIGIAKNHHLATIVALVIAFVLVKTGTWIYIWVLFGGANQLMAGLALLLVTLYLVIKGKNYRIAIYPMFFMYVTTVVALFYMVFWVFLPLVFTGKVSGGKLVGNVFSAGLAIVLIILAVILAWDGYKAFQKYKAEYGKAPAEAVEAEA